MKKNSILQLCEQIALSADKIVSVGAQATRANAPQLLGIQQAAAAIAAEVNRPEEVGKDG